VCDTNDAVDAAYAAAISAGGIDEGKPADRTYFAPGYYAANVADFDLRFGEPELNQRG
jgi:hypothetical protein